MVLVEGKHPACSCNLWTEIGTSCRHVLVVSGNLDQFCFDVSHCKSYDSHCLGDDSGEELNGTLKNGF